MPDDDGPIPGDPLARACEICAAPAGELCPTAIGLHWERARAAGLSVTGMLSWRASTAAPAGVISRLARADDLDLALAALDAACDLAEGHRAPPEFVQRLRDLGRLIGRAARRPPPARPARDDARPAS